MAAPHRDNYKELFTVQIVPFSVLPNSAMTDRRIVQLFDQYQKARSNFVGAVSDLTLRPQNVAPLLDAGVMSMLRPLLLDVVPHIQVFFFFFFFF